MEMDPSVLYHTVKNIAYITLNRPLRYNAIDSTMPFLLRKAVQDANTDDNIRVIVLKGNGKAFCAGYDLQDITGVAEHQDGAGDGIGTGMCKCKDCYCGNDDPTRGNHPCNQKMPWCPYIDFRAMNEYTQCFMSLHYSLKPVIAQVHGYAVAGGSDIALCADIVVMTDEAKIGYPPARLWGCPTTAMWVYRLGAEKAKYMMFTGNLLSGKQAQEWGLIFKSVKSIDIDKEVDDIARRIGSVPTNQLFFHKQVINQALEQQGLRSTQRLATIFDGATRHTKEGCYFQKKMYTDGFKSAVKERDSGEILCSKL